MSNWQPIETAPKQGEFLVYGGQCRPDPPIARGWPNRIAHVGWEGICLLVANANTYAVEVVGPTHWMPLPPAPSNAGKEEA